MDASAATRVATLGGTPSIPWARMLIRNFWEALGGPEQIQAMGEEGAARALKSLHKRCTEYSLAYCSNTTTFNKLARRTREDEQIEEELLKESKWIDSLFVQARVTENHVEALGEAYSLITKWYEEQYG